MPLKVTVDEAMNPVPLIVNVWGAAAAASEDGFRPVIVGTGLPAVAVTVKLIELIVSPTVVSTVMGPVVAPCGTTTVIEESVALETVALTPLKLMLLRLPLGGLKPYPLSVTGVPTGPEVGLKL
jgi:hypothetical protein